jgi:hypothetical protein
MTARRAVIRVEAIDSCYAVAMRQRLEIPPRQLVLTACALVFAVLVVLEGWIWPLKLAAVMIPVAALLAS